MTWDAQKIMAQYDKRHQEQSEWPVTSEKTWQVEDISMDVPEAIHAMYRFSSISLAASLQRRRHKDEGHTFPLATTYLHGDEAKGIYEKAIQAAKVLQQMEKNGMIPQHSFSIMDWKEMLEMGIDEPTIKAFLSSGYVQFPALWRLVLTPTVKR